MADLAARLAALEAEVQRLKDHQAIQQIVLRYGPLVDSTANDPERLAKVAEYFGEEGIYDLGPEATFNGPQFATYIRSGAHQELMGAGSTHVMSTPYIVVDGDRATALGYSNVFKNTHDGAYKVVRGSANYWEFARRGGEWKIVRRTTRPMDGTQEPRDLLFHVDERAPG